MELSNVVLARTIAFIETGRFNPRGEVSRDKFVIALRERFSFMEYPAKLEDFDRSKGISFKAGYFEGRSIEELTIYADGVKIDTRSSTEDGQQILTDTLEWLKKEVGIAYTPGMIPRWGLLSQLVVRSEIDLNRMHPAFSQLALSLSELVTDRVGEQFKFRTSGLTVDYPKLTGERNIASFTIERRVSTPDSENLFYTQSPTHTAHHLLVLQNLEESLLRESR